jgi:hypothetical protein
MASCLKSLVAAAAISLVPLAAAASTIAVDGFRVAQQVFVNDSGFGSAPTSSSTIADVSAFGGSRTLTIGTGPNPFSKTAIVDSTENNVSIGSSYGAATVFGSLAYSGSATDLTAGGLNDVFRIGVVATDGFADYTVTFNGVASQTLGFGPSTGGALDFDLSAFGPAITSVTSILVEVLSTSGNQFDTTFEFLGTVDTTVIPLPAGAFLLLGGMGVLAGVRRKKKAVAA